MVFLKTILHGWKQQQIGRTGREAGGNTGSNLLCALIHPVGKCPLGAPQARSFGPASQQPPCQWRENLAISINKMSLMSWMKHSLNDETKTKWLPTFLVLGLKETIFISHFRHFFRPNLKDYVLNLILKRKNRRPCRPEAQLTEGSRLERGFMDPDSTLHSLPPPRSRWPIVRWIFIFHNYNMSFVEKRPLTICTDNNCVLTVIISVDGGWWNGMTSGASLSCAFLNWETLTDAHHFPKYKSSRCCAREASGPVDLENAVSSLRHPSFSPLHVPCQCLRGGPGGYWPGPLPQTTQGTGRTRVTTLFSCASETGPSIWKNVRGHFFERESVTVFIARKC